MTITLMQTADAIFYYPMLVETAKTVRAFCLTNGFIYEQYVGIKRGQMPWQASYNRVYMLKEMVDRGVGGWVLYLDADAYIRDLDFDLAAYFASHNEKAAIFAGYCSSPLPYDINSGGLAINLSHPVGKALVLDWYETVRRISDADFEKAVFWRYDLANDQHLLFTVLERYVETLDCGGSILFEQANEGYVNSGPFILQHLRSMHDSFADRMTAIRNSVSALLTGYSDVRTDSAAGVYLSALHSLFFTACGQRYSGGIRSTGRPGGLLFGPYIRMRAGSYRVRIFGTVRVASDRGAVGFTSDVVSRKGEASHAEKWLDFYRTTRGLIAELPMTLAESVEDLEIRVIIGEDADIDITSVQILPV